MPSSRTSSPTTRARDCCGNRHTGTRRHNRPAEPAAAGRSATGSGSPRGSHCRAFAVDSSAAARKRGPAWSWRHTITGFRLRPELLARMPMPIDYDDMMQSGATGLAARYDEKDVMLYALGVGMGRDPLDEQELPFVYENNGLKVVPTFASVINRGEAPPERQRMPQKSSDQFRAWWWMASAASPSTSRCRPNAKWCPTNACWPSWTRAKAKARCWCRNG